MSLISLFLIAVGLSMDALAVSISHGMIHKVSVKKALIIGAYFGFFQAAMPVIGWAVGNSFKVYIQQVDHWIAFALLSYIGGKMLFEALKHKEEETSSADSVALKNLSHKMLLMLAIATSIDALIVGVTFSFLNVNIVSSALTIGLITFLISTAGALLGKKCSNLFGNKAEILGGVILILIGLKVLLEHLGVINF